MPPDKNDSSSPQRGQKWPRANSLRFYREKRDLTLQEVAKAVSDLTGQKENHQTIQRLETGKMKLTPEWAHRIGIVLRVPAKFLAFSNEPNSYSWAVKPVPVIGAVNDEMRIVFAESPTRRIGVADASAGLRALELGPGSMPGFERWVVLYDDNAREHVSQSVFERQEQNIQFVIRTRDGACWWRRVVPSARRGFYHLESLNKKTIYDVEIDHVCEVISFGPPGQSPPPVD